MRGTVKGQCANVLRHLSTDILETSHTNECDPMCLSSSRDTQAVIVGRQMTADVLRKESGADERMERVSGDVLWR